MSSTSSRRGPLGSPPAPDSGKKTPFRSAETPPPSTTRRVAARRTSAPDEQDDNPISAWLDAAFQPYTGSSKVESPIKSKSPRSRRKKRPVPMAATPAAPAIPQQKEPPAEAVTEAKKDKADEEQERARSPSGDTELNLFDQYAQSESPIRLEPGPEQQRNMSTPLRTPQKGPDW